jgi:SH3 domain protein
MKFFYLFVCFSVALAAEANTEQVQTVPAQQLTFKPSKPKTTPVTYKPGFVTEDLKTYLHSGPSANYRIIGRLSSGEKISISNQQKNNFFKVTTSKGRSGWLPNQVVTVQQPLKYQVSQLQTERDEATEKMQVIQEKLTTLQLNQKQKLSDVNQQLALAQSNLKQLQQEFAVAQAGRTAAEHALHLLQGNLTSSMWKQGALIALSGLALGFVLAFLPRPTRRKKKSSWMN